MIRAFKAKNCDGEFCARTICFPRKSLIFAELPAAATRKPHGSVRSADCKSAIRQSATLRYIKNGNALNTHENIN